MRLDDFVAQTLTSIAQGVQSAQSAVEPLGARVNPYRTGTMGTIQVVEFDVEVSATEGTATKSGLGVFVGAITAGTQGKSEAGNSSVGRVRFKVPIALPGAAGP